MIKMQLIRSNAVAALGAHSDDIAIGAGATLLFMCSANPGLQVDVLVLSGGGTEREDEEHAALTALCPGADLWITVLKLPDGRLPAHWDEAKAAVEDLREQTSPDVVFAPNRFDAHQDHRGLAELVPTAFRDHVVLGYEIVKWDGDLGHPAAYQPLDAALTEAKVELLYERYPSQVHRPWYDREAFLGLARIRGIECGARYAEAFYVSKIALDLSGLRSDACCSDRLPGLSGHRNAPAADRELWVLNLSDGEHSLAQITKRAGLPFEVISHASVALRGRDF
jgi:LmbE family N-acetylglucosaminyl deacetylase